MADEGYYLSPEEADDFRAMLQDFRSRRGNPQLRPAEAPSTGPAPEVYVAKLPTVGIPAISGTTPGSADCDIYRLGDSGLETTGPQKPVNNISSLVVKGWAVVSRDKYGKWFTVTAEFQAPCSNRFITITKWRYPCVAGKQYEETWTDTITFDSNGCPSVASALTASSQIGCCGCTSPPPGTGSFGICHNYCNFTNQLAGGHPRLLCVTITGSTAPEPSTPPIPPVGDFYITTGKIFHVEWASSLSSEFYCSETWIRSGYGPIEDGVTYLLGAFQFTVFSSTSSLPAYAVIYRPYGSFSTYQSYSTTTAPGYFNIAQCSPFSAAGRAYSDNGDGTYVDFAIVEGGGCSVTGTGSSPPPGTGSSPPPPPPPACCAISNNHLVTVTEGFSDSGNGVWNSSTNSATIAFTGGRSATVTCTDGGWTYTATTGQVLGPDKVTIYSCSSGSVIVQWSDGLVVQFQTSG